MLFHPASPGGLLHPQNPVFQTYAIAASLMILKMMGQGWITVYRMLRINGGFLNPEDSRAGLANPQPREGQLDPDEYVERSRRMHRNDTENVPMFLAAGFLFVLAGPSPTLAAWLLYGYVASRFGHFLAYLTAQSHEVRATFFTVGSLIVMYMAAFTLWKAWP